MLLKKTEIVILVFDPLLYIFEPLRPEILEMGYLDYLKLHIEVR